MIEEGGFGGGGMIEGGSQRWAVTQGKILVLAIPFAATAETLSALSGLIKGRHKILVDITNAKYSSVSETLCPVDIHQVCWVDPSTNSSSLFTLASVPLLFTLASVPLCSPSLQFLFVYPRFSSSLFTLAPVPLCLPSLQFLFVYPRSTQTILL